jgi:hypothetical protein
MDDLFLLSEPQMRRIKPYFPLSHGIARVSAGFSHRLKAFIYMRLKPGRASAAALRER